MCAVHQHGGNYEQVDEAGTGRRVRMSYSSPECPWLKAAEGLPAEFRTSMLQSLENGMKTGIDVINGEGVRAGVRRGVPTPVNQALVACIKGIEFGLEQAPAPVAAPAA
jgi:2-dehydropantoate 2-reductase